MGQEFLEHLIIAFGRRARDNQRCAGIIDQHRVHLVHDGVVVLALHQAIGRKGHVVAQVIETELAVGAKGDVGAVRFSACLAIGFMLVDAIHA